jgi:hypothetical protein
MPLTITRATMTEDGRKSGYIFIQKVIRNIKDLDKNLDSYVRFRKQCQFAFDTIKADDGEITAASELMLIRQLTMKIPEDMQGVIDTTKIVKLTQFMKKLEEILGFRKLSSTFGTAFITFKPKENESILDIKNRLEMLRNAFQNALIEDGKTAEEAANEVAKLGEMVVYSIIDALPSPINNMAAMKKVEKMDDLIEFLTKQAAVSRTGNKEASRCLLVDESDDLEEANEDIESMNSNALSRANEVLEECFRRLNGRLE